MIWAVFSYYHKFFAAVLQRNQKAEDYNMVSEHYSHPLMSKHVQINCSVLIQQDNALTHTFDVIATGNVFILYTLWNGPLAPRT